MYDAYDYTITITGSRLDETSLREYLKQEHQVSDCQIRRVRSQGAQAKGPDMARSNITPKTTKAVKLKPAVDDRTVYQHDVVMAVAELGKATTTEARLALAALGLNAENTRVHIDRLVKEKAYLQSCPDGRYPSYHPTAKGWAAVEDLRRMQEAR